MLHITLLLADTTIVGTVGQDNLWNVTVQDNLTGEYRMAQWDNHQMATITALAIGGDDLPNSHELYQTAEKLVKDWPVNVRPIP